MSGKYDDMLFLPHHVSAGHPQMSRHDRAAQFSPFAALSGYDAVLQEAGLLDQHPEVTVTWFQPDGKKEGGDYLVATGAVRKIDAYREVMILEGGEQIPFRDLLSLSGECLPDNEWRWWEKRNNLGWRNQKSRCR